MNYNFNKLMIVIIFIIILCITQYINKYNISNQDFNTINIYLIQEDKIKDYMRDNKIFIIRNFVKDIYITPDYIFKKYKDEQVEVHTTINEQYNQKIIKMTINDFFIRYKNEILYIKENLDFMYKSNIHSMFDNKIKKYFKNWIRYYCIWIGSKGSKTGLHKDMEEENFLLQLYGTKKIYIFKSNDDNKFVPREKTEGSALLSSIDFWKTKPNVVWKEIILNKGDILYLPNGWWHCAENLTETIAISCRTTTLINFLYFIITLCIEKFNSI